jgi:hypothetical protein
MAAGAQGNRKPSLIGALRMSRGIREKRKERRLFVWSLKIQTP